MSTTGTAGGQKGKDKVFDQGTYDWVVKTAKDKLSAGAAAELKTAIGTNLKNWTPAALQALVNLGFDPYAEGGYITKPTVALMGEAGPEMVLNQSQIGALTEMLSQVQGLISATITNIKPPDNFDFLGAIKSFMPQGGEAQEVKQTVTI
jgi:hypothetical protein